MPHDKLFLPDKPKPLSDTSYLQNRRQAAASCLCRGCGFYIIWRTTDTASNSCLTKTFRGVSTVKMLPEIFLRLLSLEPQITSMGYESNTSRPFFLLWIHILILWSHRRKKKWREHDFPQSLRGKNTTVWSTFRDSVTSCMPQTETEMKRQKCVHTPTFNMICHLCC